MAAKIVSKLPDNLVGLGIPGRDLHQIPLAEWRYERGNWIIWIKYDNTKVTIESGTYIELRADGKAFKVTVDTSGEVVKYEKL